MPWRYVWKKSLRRQWKRDTKVKFPSYIIDFGNDYGPALLVYKASGERWTVQFSLYVDAPAHIIRNGAMSSKEGKHFAEEWMIERVNQLAPFFKHVTQVYDKPRRKVKQVNFTSS